MIFYIWRMYSLYFQCVVGIILLRKAKLTLPPGQNQDPSAFNPSQFAQGWSCLSKEVEVDNPVWSFPTWPILWFRETHTGECSLASPCTCFQLHMCGLQPLFPLVYLGMCFHVIGCWFSPSGTFMLWVSHPLSMFLRFRLRVCLGQEEAHVQLVPPEAGRANLPVLHEASMGQTSTESLVVSQGWEHCAESSLPQSLIDVCALTSRHQCRKKIFGIL